MFRRVWNSCNLAKIKSPINVPWTKVFTQWLDGHPTTSGTFDSFCATIRWWATTSNIIWWCPKNKWVPNHENDWPLSMGKPMVGYTPKLTDTLVATEPLVTTVLKRACRREGGWQFLRGFVSGALKKVWGPTAEKGSGPPKPQWQIAKVMDIFYKYSNVKWITYM
jgi:hypothetical protein